MRKFNKKVLLFLLPIILPALFVMSYNIIEDPFGVIRGDMENHVSEPNQRYLKAKHFINNKDKYNAYIFGSSRAGKINPRNIKTTDSWYNAAYSEGLPREHLEDLQFMVENDVQITKVVIGLDNISYLTRPGPHDRQLLRKPYKNMTTPFLDYLFLVPSYSLYKKRQKVKKEKNHVFYDIYESGMPDTYFRDEWVESAKEKHCNNVKFDKPAWAFYYKPRIDEVIQEISDIIALCKEENIELSFYMGPMHVTTYLKQDIEQYSKFLAELAKITPFYDFSGLNEITTDNYYYYETSHFRPLVGDMMMASMFDNKLEDFGRLVTEDNITEVLEEKLKEAEDYRELHTTATSEESAN